MENIRSIEEFEKSKLKEKKYINHVIMKWSEGESPKIEIDAVEALQLPSKLKELRIEGFPGVKLPLDSLDHLVNLKLVNCITLKEVYNEGSLIGLLANIAFGLLALNQEGRARPVEGAIVAGVGERGGGDDEDLARDRPKQRETEERRLTERRSKEQGAGGGGIDQQWQQRDPPLPQH
ncbi:hypothetical protein Scep_010490 [Stephania cephalantha]|uniref:R13L1/DRL21-like LRR repeat region domain-containing protein n=1 Tax=Stephania cephalantha TaxID=152367 RepID=A0AAP0JVX7_9MAGN